MKRTDSKSTVKKRKLDDSQVAAAVPPSSVSTEVMLPIATSIAASTPANGRSIESSDIKNEKEEVPDIVIVCTVSDEYKDWYAAKESTLTPDVMAYLSKKVTATEAEFDRHSTAYNAALISWMHMEEATMLGKIIKLGDILVVNGGSCRVVGVLYHLSSNDQ